MRFAIISKVSSAASFAKYLLQAGDWRCVEGKAGKLQFGVSKKRAQSKSLLACRQTYPKYEPHTAMSIGPTA